MKNYLIIGGLILLAVSLFGVARTFTTPTQVTTIKTAKVLEYQQDGAFDYRVTVKPAFFYNNSLTTNPDTSPQIPVKYIEKFSLNYVYTPNPAATAKSLKINAILESPGAWKKTTTLMAEKAITSNNSIIIDLKYFQDLADAIEKEIGISASSHTLTIQTIVSGGTGPDFVQLLPINMSKTYIKISDNLTARSGGQEGKFDYQIKLGENLLLGPVTLISAVQVSAPGAVLGPKDTIFTKFIDNMDINYNYSISSSKQLRQVQEDVIIEAILENPDKWSKTFTLVPPTRVSGNVTLSFPLDLSQFTAVFDTIQQETGVQASAQNLTLKATIRTAALTDVGPIDKTYTQSIKSNLRDAIMSWSGNLKKSEPGSIDVPSPVTDEAKMLGVPVLWLRFFSVFISILILAGLGFYFLWPGKRKIGREEAQARHLSQKYKEIIVEVKEWPELSSGHSVLALGSLQDLIKVAQGLLKPVNHKREAHKEIFWVYDGPNRYEYLLSDGLNEATATDASIETKNSTKIAD